MSALSRLKAFFFGHDVFISYRRDDGAVYAEALRAALLQRKFTVYIDKVASPPGPQIGPELETALQNSSIFVFVGTPNSLRSEAMASETELWSKVGRPVVPVDFGGVLDDSEKAGQLFPGLRGAVRVREAAGASAPSREVLKAVEECATFMRQELRLRAAVIRTIVTVGLVVLTGAGVALWIMSNARTKVAQATAQATGQKQLANLAAAEAARQQGLAGAAGHAATAAQLAQRRAEAATATATAATARQQETALALRLANDASSLLRQQPYRVSDAAAMAVESVRRLSRLGVHAVASDMAIRDAVALVPEVERRFDLPEHRARSVVTPDGRFVAVAPAPREVWLVDLASKAPPRVFRSWGEVVQLALSADGSRVAAIGGYGVRVWPGAFDLETAGLTSVALSNDGLYLATASDTQTFEIFDAATGKQLAATRWPAPASNPRLEFGGSGRVLAVSTDTCSGVWDWAAGMTYFPKRETARVVLSPQDEGIAATLEGEAVGVSNWRRWNEVEEHQLMTAKIFPPRDIGFYPWGLSIWIVNGMRQVESGYIEQEPTRMIANLPDVESIAASSSYLLVEATDHTVRLYDPSEMVEIARSGGAKTEAIAVSEDGHATWCSSRGVERWRSQRKEMRAGVDASGPAAVSPDLQTSAWIDDNLADGTTIGLFHAGREAHHTLPARITAMALSARGELFAGTQNGRVYRWAAPSDDDAPQIVFERPERVAAIAVSPSGRRIAIAAGNAVSVCANDGSPGNVLSIAHSAPVTRVVFGKGDGSLATASTDGYVRSWRLGSGVATLLRTYAAHDVKEIAFGGSGRYLAAAAEPSAVWDVTSASTPPLVELPESGIATIAFDPSGAFVAVGGTGRVASVWTTGRPSVPIARIAAPNDIGLVRFSGSDNLTIFAKFGSFTVPLSDEVMSADVCRRLAALDHSAYVRACMNRFGQ